MALEAEFYNSEIRSLKTIFNFEMFSDTSHCWKGLASLLPTHQNP